MNKKKTEASHQENLRFVRQLFDDGIRPVREVIMHGVMAGLSLKTLYRAKARLNISSRKIGKEWYWVYGNHTSRLAR